MRMRKKKHLDERLNACAGVDLGWIPDPVHDNGVQMLDIHSVFGNNNPLHLEIGCGKGKFANTVAVREPDINFIAVEQTVNVLVSAMEQTEELGLTNLRYLMGKAEYLAKVIPPHSVSKIYLNFSCPYPKNTYANHRLTHAEFLEIYKRLLTDDGEIHQKTDNMHFFEFSLEQFSQSGYGLRNISLDLHNSDFEGNIMTEYEKRFTDLGQPIYRLEAYLRK